MSAAAATETSILRSMRGKGDFSLRSELRCPFSLLPSGRAKKKIKRERLREAVQNCEWPSSPLLPDPLRGGPETLSTREEPKIMVSSRDVASAIAPHFRLRSCCCCMLLALQTFLLSNLWRRLSASLASSFCRAHLRQKSILTQRLQSRGRHSSPPLPSLCRLPLPTFFR